jgi:putative spermidine/putrescine transport system permease protein
LALPLGRPSARRRSYRPEWLSVPPVLFLVIFFVVPIGYVVGTSLAPEGALTLKEYIEAFSFGANRRALVTSVTVCLYATAFTALLGAVLLLVLELAPRWAGRLVLGALLLPFVASGELVRIVAWFILLAPDGALTRGFNLLGVVQDGSSLIPSQTAVIIALVHILLPFYVFTVHAATRRIDRRPVRAAISLGARPLQAVLSAYVPLAAPAMVAGSLVVFVIALGYYATPAALGGSSTVVLPILIQNQVQIVGDWPQAAALGTLLLIIAVLVLGALFRWAGLDVLYSSVSGRDASRKGGGRLLGQWLRLVFSKPMVALCRAGSRIPAGRVVGWATLTTLAGLIVLYLAAPLVVTLGASVNASTLIGFPPEQMSARWYREFFDQSQWVPSSINSVTIGVGSAAISVILGLCCALVLARGARRLRTPLFLLAVLPMVTPWVVVALGMFFEATKIGSAYTLIGVMLGHVVLSLPFSVIVLASALTTFDWDVDRAAQASGASLLLRLRDVLVPLLRPALLTALLFGFIMSLSEVVYALFMSSVTMTTLPVVMWQGLTYSVTPVVAAAGGILTGLCLLALLLEAGSRGVSRYVKIRR